MNLNKWIDLTAPGILPLGLARLDRNGAPRQAVLGTSLKHVMVELSARTSSGLDVTGGRAPIALAQAERFTTQRGIKPAAEIQIEWAVPTLLGLGSEAVLGLSVARALALLHNLPADAASLAADLGLGPDHALEVWAFDRGGILLVEAQARDKVHIEPPLAYHRFGHQDRDDWAFAMFHPLAPEGTPATLEADRWSQLRRAAPHVSAETGRMVEAELWPALESDDLPRFGRALMEIQSLTYAALDQVGAPAMFSPVEQSILNLFRDNGAHAWGRSLTGLALYGLVRGQTAAANMKKRLLALMGHFSGTTMSSAIDSQGARHKIRELETTTAGLPRKG